MEENKLMNRLKKFNRDFCNKDDTDEMSKDNFKNKIIRAREKTLLKLRKDRLDDEIMKHRLNSFVKNIYANANKEKYSHLTINIEEVKQYLPDYFDAEFDLYDDKLEKIKEFLQDYAEEKYKALGLHNSASINMKAEVYALYAIVKLRDMSMVWESVNDEGIDLDADLVENLIKILFVSDDLKVQYELTHIIINISHDSKQFYDYFTEEEFLHKLYKMTFIKEPGLMYHVIWIFANLIDSVTMSELILSILPKLPERLISLAREYSNVFMHSEILNNIVWLIYRLLRFTKEDFVTKLVPLFPDLINFFVEEVNTLFLVNGYGGIQTNNFNTNASDGVVTNVEDPFLHNLISVFFKITHQTNDDEILGKFITSEFLNGLMRLFPDPILLPNSTLVNIFRVIAGLLRSTNPADAFTVLNYGYIEKVEKMLEKLMLNSQNINYDPKILTSIALTIVNVTSSSDSLVTQVITSKLPKYFLQIAEVVKTTCYTKEVLFAFLNAFDFGTVEDQKKIILNEHFIDFLIECVRSTDNEIIKLSLDFINMIFHGTKNFIDTEMYIFIRSKFEHKSLTVILSQLMNHDNEDISNVAELIFIDNWDFLTEYMHDK